MVLRDITAPYGRVESYVYDAVIAPAVVEMRTRISDSLLRELPHGASLLDVGCGGGHNAIGVARDRPDVRVTGVDLSPEQIERARHRAHEANVRMRFVVGSALELPFPDESFDAVMSVASIKHWPDQARGLAECVRVLRPGGPIAVIEADRGCRADDVRHFVRRWRIPSPLRPVAGTFFRTLVAGQSIDLDDARTLMATLPLDGSDVARIDGAPGLVMRGRKRRQPT